MRPRRTSTVVLAFASLLLAAACRRDQGPPSAPAAPAAAEPDDSYRPPSGIPVIDIHTHIHPAAIGRLLGIMDRAGITKAVNVSGGPPPEMLRMTMDVAGKARGRVLTFCNLPFEEPQLPGFFSRLVQAVEECHRMGALGIKISKGLGLGYVDPAGNLLRVDDPRLDLVFEKAGQLGLPVLIHTGDPKAFWRPPARDNERIDELLVHPFWSFYGQPVPGWEALFAAFEARVTRHPRTRFIGAHFGNDPEDPARVGRLLDRCPNLFIDTAARIPEIGRLPADEMHAFFVKYQDRILFGTDLGVGPEAADLMLGSSGAEPPTEAEVQRFYRSTWRYFETRDRQFDHPTPIQGRWKIDGIGLPRDVLAKIYGGNAKRLLGM